MASCGQHRSCPSASRKAVRAYTGEAAAPRRAVGTDRIPPMSAHGGLVDCFGMIGVAASIVIATG
jgi:hypothetical protein